MRNADCPGGRFVYGREVCETAYHTKAFRLPERTPEEVNAEWAARGYKEQCLQVWKELEVGIHHGKTAASMLERFPAIEQIWGVDFSRVAVAFCRRIAHPKLVVLEGDVQDLPMRASWFDWINCTDMTEHLSQPAYQRMIGELRRVAKVDARLILKQGEPGHCEHINCMSDEQLLADFGAVGWRRLRALGQGHYLLGKAR
jgi:hypothetical protein